MVAKRRPDDTRNIIESIGRGATSTVKLQGKIFKKLYHATFGALWRRFRRATVVGKIFISVGFAGAIAIAVLAAREAIEVHYYRQESVLVTIRVTSVRESPDRRAAAVAKVRRGHRLSRVGEADDWWYVRREGWKAPGWLHKRAARSEHRLILSVDYEMKGYGIAFLGAVLLMFLGFWLKKNSGPPDLM